MNDKDPFNFQNLEPAELKKQMIELRIKANNILRNHAAQTLRPSDLINEGLMRPVKEGKPAYECNFANENEFLAYVITAMKSALTDYVRKRNAQKRQIDEDYEPQRHIFNRTPDTLNRIDEANKNRSSFEELQFGDLIQTAERAPEHVALFLEVMKSVETQNAEWAALIHLRNIFLAPWKDIAEKQGGSEDSVRKKHKRALAWVQKEVRRQLTKNHVDPKS